MMKFNKKSLVLLIAAALLLTVSVGSTVAYLTAGTDELVNKFTPVTVTTDVTDDVENNVKSNVVVKNTSSIPVYMRVVVTANWVKDGEIVQAWNDYTTLGVTSEWVRGADGFYYHKGAVEAQMDVTLFTEYKALGGPDGAHLEMDIISQVIQAEPDTAVEEAWGSTALSYVNQ